MRLETLLKVIDPVGVKGSQACDVLGLTCDSRQVWPGYVFVAIAGRDHDGWEFVRDAINRGAVGIVSDHVNGCGAQTRSERNGGVCYIRVADPRHAAAGLACAMNNAPSDGLQMVGVTGTNGKTSVACGVRDMLRAGGRNPGLLTTIQYEVGTRVIPASRTTPDAILLQSLLAQVVAAGCDSAVMEVSSHALVQKRTAGIDYDVAVFTNLSHDHLDYHVTMDQYFEAKSLLFLGLGRGGKDAAAVVNIDDPWGSRLAVNVDIKAEIITYGIDPHAIVRASDIKVTSQGSSFEVHTPWGGARAHIRLRGRYNISNMLAALAVCVGRMGMEFDLAIDALSKIPLVPGRLEEIRTGKDFQVFVDYAHTDDALSHVLATLREITAGKLIVVFGCGGNRDRTKRPEMGAVAARLADYSIVTSDNPRKESAALIIDDICGGFGSATNYCAVEDRAEAIAQGLAMSGQGDVLLIAGKGHETFQEFANTIVPFDDRQVVKSICGTDDC